MSTKPAKPLLFLRTALVLIVALPLISPVHHKADMQNKPVYTVPKLAQPMRIDGDWHKPQWQTGHELAIEHFLGGLPAFRPTVKAKVLYDDESLYLIFRVQDRFVRCVEQTFNGPVWKDACVEFFFLRTLPPPKNTLI